MGARAGGTSEDPNGADAAATDSRNDTVLQEVRVDDEHPGHMSSEEDDGFYYNQDDDEVGNAKEDDHEDLRSSPDTEDSRCLSQKSSSDTEDSDRFARRTSTDNDDESTNSNKWRRILARNEDDYARDFLFLPSNFTCHEDATSFFPCCSMPIPGNVEKQNSFDPFDKSDRKWKCVTQHFRACNASTENQLYQ